MSAKINVNTQNMPPYLSEQRFGYWIQRFACLGQKFAFDDISALIPTLTVSFSNETKMDTYGVYSMEEAKEEVRKLFPSDGGVRSWANKYLSPLKTREDLQKSAGRLCDCPMTETEFDSHEVYLKIKEIADAVKFTVPRLGEYCHKEREIVLYSNNIIKSCKGIPAEEKFEEVFSHEYFHAYHYYSLQPTPNDETRDADILRRTDMTRLVVLESLASYFEAEYCKTYHIPTDLLSGWKEHGPSVYPYAGAYYIRDERKFREIIQASSDLDAALRKLLLDHKDEIASRQFYLIKNGIAPAKNRTTVTVKAPPCPQKNIDDVICHCRTELGADQSLRSLRYFNTQRMREFFARYGEFIGDKLRIVCQQENDKIVIYLETKGESHSSVALDLLRANSSFKARYGSGRPGKEFSIVISRVTLIRLDEMTDEAGKPRPLSAVVPAIDPNLRIFRDQLIDFETLLDRL